MHFFVAAEAGKAEPEQVADPLVLVIGAEELRKSLMAALRLVGDPEFDGRGLRCVA